MPLAGAVVGSGVIGGATSVLGGKQQRKAANTAANAQLQATREALATQSELANRGFDVYESQANRAIDFLTKQNKLARQDLAPLRQIGLESLRRASALTDPDSPEANAERAILARQLEQNLAARGLTGSGTELAGITDNEVKLTRERNNLLLGLAGQGANTLQSLSSLQSGLGQNLAGISQGLGSAATSLFGNLGASSAGTLLSGATNAANLRMAGDNAATQGWIGVGNAAQGTAQNLLSLARQRQLTTQGNYSPFINSNKGVTLGDLAFVG